MPCPLEQLRALPAIDIDRHQRMGAREAGQNLRQEAVGIIIGRAKTKRAGEFRFGEGRDCLVIEIDDAPGIFDESFAICGEPALPPVAHEKRAPNELFEPLHLHGNRRLGLVHFLGGAGEIAGIGYGEEGLQQVDIEIGDHGRYSIKTADG